MSDLQLSLIGLGIVLVIGVYAYNKWQERKHRLHAERIFRSTHADVLLGRKPSEERDDVALRIEPVLPAAEAPLAEAPAEASAGFPLAAGEPPADLADPAIDCIARLESAEPIAAAYLWQAQQQAFAGLARPLRWSGYDEQAGAWIVLGAEAGGRYRRLRAALQLADRRGPLTDQELTLFLNGVQRIAEEFLAVIDLPARAEILERAARLDRACAGVDIQIGVNVVAAAAPFAGTKLRGLAEAAGLVLREDGMYHACDEGGATRFTLSNLDTAAFAAEAMKDLASHGVSFALDVPRVDDGLAAFDDMIALARQFCASLGGRLVDDNRAPLADSALDVIRDKIVETGQRMSEEGLQAGSPAALRLFS
ncbi:MAG TPA: cell division protein ZipA C-terminal FtsZ-binding domain-containing protein [Candidatus Desulfobacillus sp.]|nr:cell division protein ZipA C-terminal FtsZ-binding domain-containing protein [Candidatus Desulfobacillus sp.]